MDNHGHKQLKEREDMPMIVACVEVQMDVQIQTECDEAMRIEHDELARGYDVADGSRLREDGPFI